MQRRWIPPGVSSNFLGLDDEKGRQELRLRGPSSMLPLNSIIKDAKAFKQQIYLRVNTSKLLLPLPSGTRWDNLVTRIRCKNFAKICISPKPSGAPSNSQWAMFPYQFSKNWNTRRDRISPRLTLLPPLPRLLRPAIPLWKSVNTV